MILLMHLAIYTCPLMDQESIKQLLSHKPQHAPFTKAALIPFLEGWASLNHKLSTFAFLESPFHYQNINFGFGQKTFCF